MVTNPSFELGTTGCGTIQAGTVGTTSAVQAFGAWSGSVATTSNGTAGFMGPSFTAGNGTAYTFSFYGSFPSGSTFRAGMGDSSGVNLISGSFIGTGVGAWQRYSGTWTEASGAARRLTIRKNSDTNAYAFYVDAMQYEAGSLTTYIDGDQGQGYVWDGPPHASPSLRAASVRTGGTVCDLGDLGFTVLDMGGVGMPDVAAVGQEYGFLDGGFYQRTRAQVRSFVLTGLMSGTTWQDFHAIRRRVIDLVKPDLTPTPQPFRMLYTGAGGSSQIDCVYDSGLQFGERNGFTETAGVRVVSFDPYWRTVTERGTSLSPFTNLGSTNFLAYRNPVGQWGTLGVNGVTLGYNVQTPFVSDMARQNEGTVTIVGIWGSVNGGQGTNIAFITGTALGTYTNSQFDAGILSVVYDSAGSLTVAGGFGNIGGSARNDQVYIVRRTTTGWGSLPGGTLVGGATGLLAIRYFGGSLVLAGDGVITISGTAATRGIVFHGGARYGTFTGGTVHGGAYTLAAVGPSIVVGGSFSLANGTATPLRLAAYTNGLWGSIAGTVAGTSPAILFPPRPQSLAVTPDYRVIAGFTGISALNGGSVSGIFQSNLTGASPIAYGLGSGTGNSVLTVAVSPSGELWAGGLFNSRGTSYALTDGLARSTGANWVNADIDLAAGGTVDAMLFMADGGLYVGGRFAGTAIAAAVGTVANPATANTAFALRMRAPASGTARVFQISNATTNKNIWLDLTIQPSEIVTLTTTPGGLSLTSNYRGNLIGAIVPGSNLTSFVLAPGQNILSFFADNSGLVTDLMYRPVSWSADGSQV